MAAIRPCSITVSNCWCWQAVLFRTSSHSALLELELARRNIPFVKYGGLKFLDAAHVKDVLSLLRWIENPRGRLAAFRAVRMLSGVGPATATRLLDAIEASPDPVGVMRSFCVPAAATAEWSSLLELYEALRSTKSEWPGEMDRILAWYLFGLVCFNFAIFRTASLIADLETVPFRCTSGIGRYLVAGMP